MTPRVPRIATPARALRLAAGIGLVALAVSGCAPTTTAPYGADLGAYEATPRELIAVDSVAGRHVVHLAGRTGAVSWAERRRLAGFITGIARNRPDSLRVALHGRASSRQLRAVTRLLVTDGVNPEHIRWAGWRGGLWAPSNGVVVAVERAIAVQPLCPGSTGHLTAPNDNLPEPNFGCSDMSNLAAMLADPHDLRQPSSTIYSDGERAATAVAEYRADKVKELKSASGTSSSGSGSGSGGH